MVFLDPVVWPCDICHERRQEQYLTLQTENVRQGPPEHGMGRLASVRYCQDRMECVKESMRFLRWKVKELEGGSDARKRRAT